MGTFTLILWTPGYAKSAPARLLEDTVFAALTVWSVGCLRVAKNKRILPSERFPTKTCHMLFGGGGEGLGFGLKVVTFPCWKMCKKVINPTSEAGSPKLCCITARNAHRTQTLFILDGLPHLLPSAINMDANPKKLVLCFVFSKQTEDDPSLLGNCSLSLSKLKKGTLLANIFHEPELCILPECTSLHRRRRLQSCQMSLWAKSGPKISIFQSFHLKTGCCVFIDF